MAIEPTNDVPTVHIEERDGVLVITIDRPKVRNAINGATARALVDAFDQLDARDDLMVGVLTGTGGTFSAGMDLKAYAAGDTPVIPGGASRASPEPTSTPRSSLPSKAGRWAAAPRWHSPAI